MMGSDRKRAKDKPKYNSDLEAGERAADNLEALTEKLRWTAQDGTRIHKIYEQSVEDAIDDVDNDVAVWNGEAVGVSREGRLYGVIDTSIEHGDHTTIVDYKTHDMTDWTVAKAKRIGKEQGKQVESYVRSPQTPSDAQGYIIAVGRRPKDVEVEKAYVEVLAKHGVKVKFAEGGEPEHVVKAVREAMSQTEQRE